MTYELIEADRGIAGRANLVSPSIRRGWSSIEGTVVSASLPESVPVAVPEPLTLILCGSAVPPMLLGVWRRRRRAASVPEPIDAS